MREESSLNLLQRVDYEQDGACIPTRILRVPYLGRKSPPWHKVLESIVNQRLQLLLEDQCFDEVKAKELEVVVVRVVLIDTLHNSTQ